RLPGPRVADDDGRPEDRRRDPVEHAPDPDLGLELGRLVVVLEALTAIELVLVDDAGPVAGDVGGADVVEPLEALDGSAEGEDVAGPLDVDAMGDGGGHGEVVDRGEMVDDVGLGGEGRVPVLAQARPRSAVSP